MKVYVLRGHKGEYSQYETGLLAAYVFRGPADDEAGRLNGIYKAQAKAVVEELEAYWKAQREFAASKGRGHFGLDMLQEERDEFLAAYHRVDVPDPPFDFVTVEEVELRE